MMEACLLFDVGPPFSLPPLISPPLCSVLPSPYPHNNQQTYINFLGQLQIAGKGSSVGVHIHYTYIHTFVGVHICKARRGEGTIT